MAPDQIKGHCWDRIKLQVHFSLKVMLQKATAGRHFQRGMHALAVLCTRIFVRRARERLGRQAQHDRLQHRLRQPMSANAHSQDLRRPGLLAERVVQLLLCDHAALQADGRHAGRPLLVVGLRVLGGSVSGV